VPTQAEEQRSTKIVATLGPATSELEVLTRLIAAGVNVVRLNFSHGKAEDHIGRAQCVRDIAAKLGLPVAVMVDLQGPKIRVGKFEKNKVTLNPGQTFILDSTCDVGNEPGAVLLLDDGRIVLDVEAVIGAEIHTRVRVGGVLSNNKGINRQGGGLSAPALTAKDMEDIKVAARLEADYVAVSFPKSSADMYMARTLLQAAGSRAQVVAKIERTEAIANLEELVEASDAIMVARGDLAVEVGDAAVPALQKRMIRLAREKNKLTITATQMMESMINSPVPTRAEVSDVANAVLDGTDAVMLSAETAAGKYPVETVEAMARVCLEAEKSTDYRLDRDMLSREFARVDQSIAMAALFTANHMKVKAVVALTQTGATALWISRVNCGVPIYALTPELSTYRRLSLYRDVFPMLLAQDSDQKSLLVNAELKLLEQGLVQPGDLLVLTVGDTVGQMGSTNTMKIVRVSARV
jgi:pyruvate kinase